MIFDGYLKKFGVQVGVPVAGVDQADVYQENEDLKEELARLAAKVEGFSLWGH